MLRTILMLFAVAVLSLSAQAQERLRIGTEASYPPFASIDENGEMQGFEIELVNAICAEMAVECELINHNFDGLIPALRVRKFDAVAASMSITPDRKKSVDFSRKYYQTPAKFVAPKSSDIDVSAEGLAGKTIGVQSGTIHDRYLTDNFDNVDIRRYGTLDEAFLDLQFGRIDLIMADSMAIKSGILDTDKGSDYTYIGPDYTDPRWFGEGVGFAVRKGNDELRQRLNDAIAAVREDGTYEKIQNQYFDFDVYGQ